MVNAARVSGTYWMRSFDKVINTFQKNAQHFLQKLAFENVV